MNSKSPKALLALALAAALAPSLRAEEQGQSKPVKNGAATKHQSHKLHKPSQSPAVKAVKLVQGQPNGPENRASKPIKAAPASGAATPASAPSGK